MALPGNSLNASANNMQDVEPVVNEPARLRKKPFTKRLAGAFLSADSKSLKEKVTEGILIPVIKDTFVTIIVSTVETLFYGSPNGRIKNAVGALTTSTPYTNYSDPLRNRNQANYTQNNGVVRIKSLRGVDDILTQTQSEAVEILRHLNYDIEKFGSATVAKAYLLSKLKADYMDEEYGWTDLSAATVTKMIGQQGYVLSLPAPIYLKRN